MKRLLLTIIFSCLILFGITSAATKNRAGSIIFGFEQQFQSYSPQKQLKSREQIQAILNKAKIQKKDDVKIYALAQQLSTHVNEKIRLLIMQINTHTEPDLQELRTDLLDVVNQERESRGLGILILNDKLNIAAQNHAIYMSETKDFAHETIFGQTPWDRIAAVGYQYQGAGENLARGYISVSQVMHDWMMSPGHKENIIQPKFTEIGIGYVDTYWVQIFGKPK